MQWKSSFTANTTYVQPSLIQKWASAPHASAPQQGWAHSSLGEAFKFTPPTPSPDPTKTNPPGNNSSTPAPPKRVNKLAIGLGTGLGLGIPILAGALFFFLCLPRLRSPPTRHGTGSGAAGDIIMESSTIEGRQLPDNSKLYREVNSHSSPDPSVTPQTEQNTPGKSE
jgi:hypothetical protein